LRVYARHGFGCDLGAQSLVTNADRSFNLWIDTETKHIYTGALTRNSDAIVTLSDGKTQCIGLPRKFLSATLSDRSKEKGECNFVDTSVPKKIHPMVVDFIF
jgi:hypothetical protein